MFLLMRQLREVLKLGWSQASRFSKRRLMTALLLIVGGSILMALSPVALKLIVDGFAHPRADQPDLPWYLIGFFVLTQWLARASHDVRIYIYSRAERRIMRTLTERLFTHLMQLPLRLHLERRTGAINKIMDDGMNGYQTLQHNLVFTILPIAVEIGAVVVVLVHLSYGLFLMLFCGALVCYAAAFAYAVPTVSPAAEEVASANIDASDAVTDRILNYETVKYFAAESIVQEEVSRALARTETAWDKYHRTYAVNALGISTLFAGFLALTAWLATREVQQGRLTVGDFVLVCGYMLQTLRPIEMLGHALYGVSEGLVKVERMLGLLREVAEPGPEEGMQLDEPAGALEFENVSMSYGTGPPALSNVTFKVPAGKTVGIVGASGSGKSTIVRLLVRLLEPQAGRILLDNMPVEHLSLPQLRRLIAVVPQDTVLFNDTIGYNIWIGDPTRTHQEIERAAKVARLHDFIMRLPRKYGTVVGERGAKLSMGERQRVAIARAALKKPMIYVLDEATSSLDSESERAIMRNIQEISRRCTTFVIAHRLSTVVHADEIIVLESGSVVEQGTHQALLKRNGRYALLWKAQQGDPEYVSNIAG